MLYNCEHCGKPFDYPLIEKAPSRIKNMWILIICGFFTCGLGWLLLPAAIIKVPDIKKCPHCLKKINNK